MSKAVVFAYHNVGVRCLQVLLAHGVDVALVVSHEDNPAENVWFESVASVAKCHGIPLVTPTDPNTAEMLQMLTDIGPDFIFSFYYRHMLQPEILALANRGAYNMHGSLLPKFRGRAPVNWAVLQGERETGASLHSMTAKPDAGEIVAQQAVPILPNDTAHDVFQKVTVAAEMALDHILLKLLAGTAPHHAQDLAAGSYFGGRKPADGYIDWHLPANMIHNLVRAVAPPYPGAFSPTPYGELRVLRSLCLSQRTARTETPTLYAADTMLLADCGDGNVLQLLEATLDGKPYNAAACGRDMIPLT